MFNNDSCVLDLNKIGYEDAFRLQRKLVDARLKGVVGDTLLLLEHPPVFTGNREETFQNILASEDKLRQQGILVCKTDRGGDVTYHGPGQIVGYSIMDLKTQGRDLHVYIRNMEQLIIDTLAEYGIDGKRDKEHPGVWVGNEKIAAIGIAVKRGWISMHGFSLNIDPNMDHFKMIIPCGIQDRGVTSMRSIIGGPVNLGEVKRKIVNHYGEIFNLKPKKVKLEDLAWL